MKTFFWGVGTRLYLKSFEQSLWFLKMDCLWRSQNIKPEENDIFIYIYIESSKKRKNKIAALFCTDIEANIFNHKKVL